MSEERPGGWGSDQSEPTRNYWLGSTKPSFVSGSSRKDLTDMRLWEASRLPHDLLLSDMRVPRFKDAENLRSALMAIPADPSLLARQCDLLRRYLDSNPELTNATNPIDVPSDVILSYQIPLAVPHIVPLRATSQCLGLCAETTPMLCIFRDKHRRKTVTTLSIRITEFLADTPNYRRMCATCEATMIALVDESNVSMYVDLAKELAEDAAAREQQAVDLEGNVLA
ncbi:hypothetical protein BJ508DRAFT_378444 [Ascobolus immersus RN42]|uniref:Uncharacterized protein n=1 Tax=Ascobolus immersus RN42 TaxID=1160509 RepID=A0A3N4HWS8_ASCIM|nr:hypothetical protein BJ508DRAFT_378444 [Ascobolus immersus RN42]